MSKAKKVILTVILIMILSLNFLLFFGIVPIEKTGIEISSFVFIIISELIAYGVTLWTTRKKSDAFSNAGIFSCTFIYIIVSLIFNVVLRSIFNTVKNNLIFNFSALLIYGLLVTTVILFKKENRKDD